jgi:lysophospholipase L1-like esterase
MVGIGLLVMAATASASDSAHWIATWGAAQIPGPAIGTVPPAPHFSRQTLRELIRVSAGGTRVRVRLSNEYGSRPLVIGSAFLAIADSHGKVRLDTSRQLTFQGKPTAVIPTGSPYLSDPIELDVKPLATLSISLYLPEDTGPCTWHPGGAADVLVSPTGDFTRLDFKPQAKMQARAFLSDIEVDGDPQAKVVAVLGDSLADGMGSTPDADRRWPDLLAARLNDGQRRPSWGVVNLSITGNRVIDDGAGPSAMRRFDTDVLSVPGITYVIVTEGINDIGLSYGLLSERYKPLVPARPATADTIVAGYVQLIKRAHARGIRVFGATLLPYSGSDYYSASGESVRQAVNQWIRTSHAFDAVLDFDATLRDRRRPEKIADALQAGDHLHGNDAGYERLARSIDLSLFK